MIRLTKLTTVEFPEDRVYNECKTIVTIDHQGHISVTFIDSKTGDDLVMVYLGKDEITKIVKLYVDNVDLVETEGVKKDEIPGADTTEPDTATQPTTP
jgi:hypothetical protein